MDTPSEHHIYNNVEPGQPASSQPHAQSVQSPEQPPHPLGQSGRPHGLRGLWHHERALGKRRGVMGVEEDWKQWNKRLTLAVICAGALTGAAAWLLKWMVAHVSRLVTHYFRPDTGNWWLIPLAVVAILFVGWLVRRVARTPLEETTALIKGDLKTGSDIKPKIMFWPLIGAALTLGCGGSAGSEGPIAYSGAAIANNLARWCKVDRRWMQMMLACGAGAGIAAIFKSPVGGMFYTIEVLGMAMSSTAIVVLGVMCLLAGGGAYVLSGLRADMIVTAPLDYGLDMTLAAVFTGVVGGVYAIYYRQTGLGTRHRIQALRRPVVRNLLSGLTLGVLLFMYPALYGEGYQVLGQIADTHTYVATQGSITLWLGGNKLIWALGGILLVKGIATYATNSGGGVAGDFAPTLFAGGILGAFLYTVCGHWGIMQPMTASVMVLCGMGAVMAGVIRAPLMALFLVVEMTMAQNLIVPVGISVAVAFTISMAWRYFSPGGRG